MDKNIKKWEICKKCLNGKTADMEVGRMLFAGFSAIINKYIQKKHKWINPVRLIGEDKHSTELCDNCEFKLEHDVIGQKRIKDK